MSELSFTRTHFMSELAICNSCGAFCLHASALRNAEDQRLVQTMGFVVGKNRHGNTGTVMMDFVGATANILEGRDTKR